MGSPGFGGGSRAWPYLVTLEGPNFATEFLTTMIYRESIPLGEVGYGAALSIILLSLALVMAFVVSFRARRGIRSGPDV